jgi:hypothetical protein
MDVYYFLYQVTLEVDLRKQSPTKPMEWLAIEQNSGFWKFRERFSMNQISRKAAYLRFLRYENE